MAKKRTTTASSAERLGSRGSFAIVPSEYVADVYDDCRPQSQWKLRASRSQTFSPTTRHKFAISFESAPERDDRGLVDGRHW